MNVLFIMDPIDSITVHKDTTLALMLEAQRRGHDLFYAQHGRVGIDNGDPFCHCSAIQVKDDAVNYYQTEPSNRTSLSAFDVIFMRTDPPVDALYTYTTHLLSLVESRGTLVVNPPHALRDFNEKLFATHFPKLMTDTLVTMSKSEAKQFQQQHGSIICKPLDGMGGSNIFKVDDNGTNLSVIMDVLTQNGTQLAMLQRFLPEINEGDKRILIIDGEVIPYCLARVPALNETRGNLAAGGSGRPQEVTQAEQAIAGVIAERCRQAGLIIVGLDMIGTHVTEINVTSPTCFREIEAAYRVNICGKVMEAVEKRLK